ncbi:MAG: hypothetical protein Kow0092_05370 [Deferrisomatales bacterium]
MIGNRFPPGPAERGVLIADRKLLSADPAGSGSEGAGGAVGAPGIHPVSLP